MNKQDAIKRIEAIEAEAAALRKLVQEPEVGRLWTPTKGADYWLLGCDGHVCRGKATDDLYDKRSIAFGNCFPTKGVAEKALPLLARAHKIIQAALQVDADAGAFKYGERNWSVWCRREDGKWVPVPWGCAHSGLPYVHTKEQAERMAAILNAEGVV